MTPPPAAAATDCAAARAAARPPPRVLLALASLKLTMLLLLVLGLAILLSYRDIVDGSWALALPLAACAVNVAAAVMVRPGFRRQRALLLFHLGLIAIVLLLAAGRLSYLRGTVEVAEGAQFDGQLSTRQAGPWHWGALDRVHFSNDGFQIAYAAGVARDRTRNAVSYTDEEGVARQAEIGDQAPLVLYGYRFYTSPNKGYAPTFAWYPNGGAPPTLGAVHLPSYPLHQYRQAREWVLPGTAVKVWTMLSFEELILDPQRPSAFRLPARYAVVVRTGQLRRVLEPGQSIVLPEGTLVFDSLRTWMGYSVFYDWTTGPLLASCLLSVVALGWHLACKYAAKPWNTELPT
jgi:hypothetical protein